MSNIYVEHICRTYMSNIYVEHICQTYMSNIYVEPSIGVTFELLVLWKIYAEKCFEVSQLVNFYSLKNLSGTCSFTRTYIHACIQCKLINGMSNSTIIIILCWESNSYPKFSRLLMMSTAQYICKPMWQKLSKILIKITVFGQWWEIRHLHIQNWKSFEKIVQNEC
jgi:hypothetical protein